eukprot:11508846-Alexandrium_andersonii.AAC.2
MPPPCRSRCPVLAGGPGVNPEYPETTNQSRCPGSPESAQGASFLGAMPASGSPPSSPRLLACGRMRCPGSAELAARKVFSPVSTRGLRWVATWSRASGLSGSGRREVTERTCGRDQAGGRYRGELTQAIRRSSTIDDTQVRHRLPGCAGGPVIGGHPEGATKGQSSRSPR